jgi:hypothetical protein
MAKKKMLQFNPELHEALTEKVVKYGYPVSPMKMFGHEVYFLNGYMFTGANEDGIFVHLGEEAVLSALSRAKGVSAFHPMEGMTMKDYLLLTEETHTDSRKLKKWLDGSAQYLSARPPKVKKPKKKKA